MDKNSKVFGEKSLTDIFEDAYNNINTKQKYIDDVLSVLKKSLRDNKNNVDKVITLSRLIKEYIDTGTKLAELFIKLSAVVQRLITKNNSEDDNDDISEEEKEKLLTVSRDIKTATG